MHVAVSQMVTSMVAFIAVHGLRAGHHIGGHLAVESRTLALLLLRGVVRAGLHLLPVGVMRAQVTATIVVSARRVILKTVGQELWLGV